MSCEQPPYMTISGQQTDRPADLDKINSPDWSINKVDIFCSRKIRQIEEGFLFYLFTCVHTTFSMGSMFLLVRHPH